MDDLPDFIIGGALLGGGVEVAKQVISEDEIDVERILSKSVSGGVFGLGMGLIDDIFD